MTIDEAIKLLDINRIETIHKGELRLAKAQELGIEALKRIEKIRERYSIWVTDFLPGETEETKNDRP